MIRFAFLFLLQAGGCAFAQQLPPRNTQQWALLSFVKADRANPVLQPDASLQFTDPVWNKPVRWAQKDVFNPATVVKGDTVFLLFRAEDTVGRHAGVSRIGLAWSTDGLKFTPFPEPVFFPQPGKFQQWEWEGGCEDPRVVQDSSGRYIMTYTAYDGKTARLMVATSPDMRSWTKHGPAFKNAFGGKYIDKWSKSGSIAALYHEDGRIVAEKLGGKYWMYWGDVNIWAATSDDLVNWSPVLYKDGEQREKDLRHNAPEIAEVKTVVAPRKKKFDSDLVEPGPPAMITDYGIVLLYNGRNVPSIGDAALAEGTYAAGQVLLNKSDPTNVLQRLDHYFLRPEKPYEITGQVAHVCFIEGLARFKGKWYLYYGTADSKIAVAVK
ncbi:glycoside hydrolase family 130 protein [Paracnuella aquatica]|uniref:glycoside hydrolase family 130 protein n=1 Tax=Paracnuella aquatica TaxID=2268757 RepID=UPI000DEEB580|nr:glycoside hydrolase family 130 protein [Paracnuella aquatica]RPD43798.1 glycosidase [Paracnuella aquatica]